MTKKKPDKENNKQYQKFLEKVQELVDAGELSPTEADERFEQAMKKIAQRSQKSSD